MRLIFFFLLLSLNVVGQVDSKINTRPIPSNFNKTMALSQASDNQLDTLFILITEYGSVNNDSSLILAKKGLALATQKGNQLFLAIAQIRLGRSYYLTGEEKKAKTTLQDGKDLAISIDKKTLIAEANDILGDITLNEGKHEKALDYFIEAANIWEETRMKKDQAYTYINISGLFFNTDELPKAIKYTNKAALIAKELNDNKLSVDIGGMQGINLMTYGIHYYLKNEQDTSTAHTIMDTLNYYFNAAEKKYHETLNLARKTKSIHLTVTLLNNMVALKLNMEKFNEALELAKEAEGLAENLGAIELLIQSKFNLASVYRRFGEFEKSAKYGKESLALAKKHKLERKEFLANRVLYDLYVEIGDYKKANAVLEEIRAYEKKIGNAERNKAVAKIEAEYQTVKREKEILELKEKNKRIARQRNYIIGGLLLFGIILFGMLRFNKIRKERNDKKSFAEALMYTQEAERKRIAQDLHDGIGQSLLLLKKQLATNQNVSSENQAMITQTLEEVRTISRDLHPMQLERFGLTVAIQNVIQKVDSSTDLFITTDIQNIDKYFNNKTNIQIYRAVQEALNNIIKHAQATATRITIEVHSNHVVITILDNGKGFDYELAVVQSKSLGLKTMFERLSSVRGKMKITPNQPSGTKVEFRIPIRLVHR